MIDVLALDDDVEFLQLLNDLLRPPRYHLRMFSQAPQAILALWARPPQLLILDLMLPVLDGVQVYHRIRANPATAQLPIIISTAALPHVWTAALNPADANVVVLAKPYCLDTLQTTIERFVGAA